MSYRNPQTSDNQLRRAEAQISGQRKQNTGFSDSKNAFQPPPIINYPQLNCIFNICYNGEPRQFALHGQILRKDEEFDPIPPLIQE